MKAAPITAALGLLVGGLTMMGVMTAAGDDPPVTTPITPPVATVAPDVAQRFNGAGKPVIAPGLQMRPAKPIPGNQLMGKGRGNGCVPNYGDPGQCLPRNSISQQKMPHMNHPWTCGGVRTLFPQGVIVRHGDPLKLDSNNDGVACGQGDA